MFSFTDATLMLWFHKTEGKAQPLIDYYGTILGDLFEPGNIQVISQVAGAHTEAVSVKCMGMKCVFLATEQEHQPLNDSFSFMLHCKDQAEIDVLWNYFTLEGKESMCGWCQDKYGLRWQILPKNFSELIQKPNGGQILASQHKIVIAEYN